MMGFFIERLKCLNLAFQVFMALIELRKIRIYGNVKFDLHSNSFFQVISILYWQFWLGPKNLLVGGSTKSISVYPHWNCKKQPN